MAHKEVKELSWAWLAPLCILGTIFCIAMMMLSAFYPPVRLNPPKWWADNSKASPVLHYDSLGPK